MSTTQASGQEPPLPSKLTLVQPGLQGALTTSPEDLCLCTDHASGVPDRWTGEEILVDFPKETQGRGQTVSIPGF